MAIAFEHDELFRFAGAGEEGFALGPRDKPIVVGSDEQHRPRRNPVDHPFGVEAQSVVDKLERDRGNCRRVVAAGRHAELGGLTVRQQDLGAFNKSPTPLAEG